MNALRWQIPLTLALCLGAAAVTRDLARQSVVARAGQRQAATLPAISVPERKRPVVTLAAGSTHPAAGLGAEVHRLSAGELWGWLELHGQDDLMTTLMVAREVFERDPAAALEHFAENRGRFPGEAGKLIATCAVAAAAGISAEAMTDALERIWLPGDYMDHRVEVTYPPDFDFKAVMEYMVASRKGGHWDGDLLVHWAEVAPFDALAYLQQVPWGVRVSLQSYASLFMALARVPETDRSRMAEVLREDGGVSGWELLSQHGGIMLETPEDSRAVLDMVTRLGQRDSFLRDCLERSAGRKPREILWNEVADADRRAVFAEVFQAWEKEDPSPVATRAREQWKKSAGQEWGWIGSD